MRKTLLTILLLSVFSIAASAQSIKYGATNVEDIIKLMPETDSARVRVEAKTAELTKDLQTSNAELQKKYEVYQKTNTTLSSAMRQAKEKELQDMQAQIQQFTEAAQIELQELQAIAMKPAIDKINAAIEKIAKANGITFVIDRAQQPFVYMNEAVVTDITPLLKAELKLK